MCVSVFTQYVSLPHLSDLHIVLINKADPVHHLFRGKKCGIIQRVILGVESFVVLFFFVFCFLVNRVTVITDSFYHKVKVSPKSWSVDEC